MTQEHKFITYIRTKQLLNERLRGQVEGVELTEHDKKRFNVTNEDLHQLITIGAIQSTPKGYKVVIPGTIDLSLIKKDCQRETDLHKWMKRLLLYVELPDSIQAPDYFSIFTRTRNEFLNLFFTVDAFSGRVHTPVSNLHRVLRPELIFMGETVVSCDVAQMQPTLLGNILSQHIGNNSFSDAINEGKDVYTMLQTMAKLQSRDEAKKRFFEMLFSRPTDELGKLFSDGGFMKFINAYKSRPEPRNPHGARQHTNLAWLLQSYEVFLMSQVWQRLAEHGMPFLTVHDELILRKQDAEKGSQIINEVLSNHFKTYKLNIK